MNKSKEELVVELFTMDKGDIIQLFLILTLEHKKLLLKNAELKGKLRARGEALGLNNEQRK